MNYGYNGCSRTDRIMEKNTVIIRKTASEYEVYHNGEAVVTVALFTIRITKLTAM